MISFNCHIENLSEYENMVAHGIPFRVIMDNGSEFLVYGHRLCSTKINSALNIPLILSFIFYLEYSVFYVIIGKYVS